MNEIPPPHALVRFGVLELDTKNRELRKQYVKVRLKEQPLQILEMLVEHPDRIVTRNELQRRIWPSDTFVGFDSGLYNAVKRLREALGDSGEGSRFIETLSRRGYRLIAPVEGSDHAVTTPTPTLEITRPPLGLESSTRYWVGPRSRPHCGASGVANLWQSFEKPMAKNDDGSLLC